jgi:NitT/TauT family transport system substrate-binding protein
MRLSISAAALAVLLAAPLRPAHADAPEIRLAKQFSMGYLQFNILEHEKLIEKHARAAGLGDVKVTWATFNGPDAMNAALIADSVDVVAGGVPGLVTLWAKTHGTPQEVRGITAFSSQPFLLNTRNPNVRSIEDLGPGDKIAVPAIKVSVQAVTLQMAAAQRWGRGAYAKLDPLTVSMSPQDATVALLSGGGEITSVFSVPPFQYQQLEHPGIRTILNSFDVLGGSHSFTVAWTSSRFRAANPKLYPALVGAFEEATQRLNADKRQAAGYWIEDSKSKLPLDFVAKLVSGPQVTWTMTPENTMKFAAFMAEVGTIKAPPASWKELFFPELHDRPGS